MAKQSGNFGGFSSPVSTTGMGQGAAQVFQPAPVQRLDTTAIQRGIASIGQGLQQRQAQDRVKKLQEAKALADIEQGIYATNNQAKQFALQTAKEQYIEDDDYDKYISTINALANNASALNSFEEKVAVPNANKGIQNPNKLSYDPETDSYTSYGDKLMQFSGELTDEQKELIKQDPSLGLFNQAFQQDFMEIERGAVEYDPTFSLSGAAMQEFQDYLGTKGVSEQSDVAAAFGRLNEGADLKTVFEEYPDLREGFMQHLQTRSDLQDKWVNNYIVNEGLSPYHKNKPEFRALATDAFLEELGGVSLPEPSKTKRMGVVKKSDAERGIGGDGDDDDIVVSEVITTRVSDIGGGSDRQKEEIFGGRDVKVANLAGLPKTNNFVTEDGKQIPNARVNKVVGGANGKKYYEVNYKESGFSAGGYSIGAEEKTILIPANKQNEDTFNKIVEEADKNTKKNTKATLTEFEKAELEKGEYFGDFEKEKVDKLIESEGGWWDSEDDLYEKINAEFNVDVATDDAFADFRKIIDNISFNDKADRKKAIDWLSKNMERIATGQSSSNSNTGGAY